MSKMGRYIVDSMEKYGYVKPLPSPPVCDYAKHYEPYDWCTLSDNPCFKDTGECDEYNEYLKEVSNEGQ